MANIYPRNIVEYLPQDSERIVYQELKNQLPDTWDVFYSVSWTAYKKGKRIKSEADFIVCSPEYGFICLEVKGGSGIRKENNIWYLDDFKYGERKLPCSPYDQAEKSMYYFENAFMKQYNIQYSGIFGAGVVFPFYAISDINIDNRHRICTIDCHDLNKLQDRIQKMFRLWGGDAFGVRVYGSEQHRAFVELVRDRIAISAAAGALVRYKEQQLKVINRVQDNYVYFLKNINRFYIKGGAGTGKTWIAKKMAIEDAQKGKKVLFLCASKYLAKTIAEELPTNIDVFSMRDLLHQLSETFETYSEPMYLGISESITLFPKYDAIFVDEAQDFNREWARIVNTMLKDRTSRLGVFYDEIQILREHSFDNEFDISGQPYLLRENIRNTANIYSWTAENTNLGKDVIINPVEGPVPITYIIRNHNELTFKLEGLFKKFIDDEHLSNSSMIIITDYKKEFFNEFTNGIAKWKFVSHKPKDINEVHVVSVEDFKGLESDMVIYVHSKNSNPNINYIAYTRAKYYLIELIRS